MKQQPRYFEMVQPKVSGATEQGHNGMEKQPGCRWKGAVQNERSNEKNAMEQQFGEMML